jgi:hypothetical protein
MLRSAYHFLVVALIGCLAGYLLRTYIVQPAEMGAMCSTATQPAWCVARDFLIQGMISGLWGKLALGFIALSIVLFKIPFTRLLLVPGLFFAGVSLFLFGPLLGASAVVTGLIRGITFAQTDH